eukprot:5745205-Amphidinium_carterae.1
MQKTLTHTAIISSSSSSKPLVVYYITQGLRGGEQRTKIYTTLATEILSGISSAMVAVGNFEVYLPFYHALP